MSTQFMTASAKYIKPNEILKVYIKTPSTIPLMLQKVLQDKWLAHLKLRFLLKSACRCHVTMMSSENFLLERNVKRAKQDWR